MKANTLVGCAIFLGLSAAPAVFQTSETAVLAQQTRSQFSQEEQTSINVYNQASPAVVTIRTGRSSGSGSIIRADGLVITNEHVIRGAQNRQVTVTTSTGRNYRGQVLTTDTRNDLALIQLQTNERLPFLRLATSNDLRVGQRVYAIGSPFGLSGTFTTGTLSRIAPNGDLQTDAAINPGNSGGPLLNSRAELIGVNKAILSSRNGGGNIGIGFATSVRETSQFVASSLQRINGNVAGAPSIPSAPVASAPQPAVASPNVTTRPVSSNFGVSVDAQTLVIQAVQPGSLAHRIGLQRGDRFVAINRQQLRNANDLAAFLNTRPQSAIFTFARNQRLANVQVNF